MAPPPDEQTSKDFLDTITKVQDQLKEQTERMRQQAEERHRINGKFTAFFMQHNLSMEVVSEALRHSNEAATVVASYLQQVSANLKLFGEKIETQNAQLKVHEFLLRGADGTNGISGDMKYVKKRQQGLETRVAVLSVGLGSAGSGVVFLIKYLLGG